MPYTAITSSGQSFTGDVLLYFCWEEKTPSSKFLKSLDSATGGAVRDAFAAEEFTGEANSMALFRKPVGWKVKAVLLIGVGKRKGLQPDAYRQAAGVASRHAFVKKASAIGLDGDGDISVEIASALVEGFELGRWKMTDYRTDAKTKTDSSRDPKLSIVTSSRMAAGVAQKGIDRGHIAAHAVGLCRRLANQPSNVLTPDTLAQEIKLIGKQWGFSVSVFDENRIAKERMGCVLGVGKGSANPPRFITMEYRGAGAKEKPLVLVGKGVCFDSGGISIKPAENMHEMKGDMTGAAVVTSVMAAAAKLKLKLNLVALVPSVENMPSSRAYKPGDILTSRKGKTIEVMNTDAEGRLILADALDYANTFNPQAVIDIATLTGAAIFVTGYTGAPIMGTNATLVDRVKASSKATAEKVWELPLWPEFTERLKSQIADVINTAGRPAGTAVAGCFLKEFIGDWPWAHIDIAWVDIEHNGKPYSPAGPSGFGVRLLIDLASKWRKM